MEKLLNNIYSRLWSLIPAWKRRKNQKPSKKRQLLWAVVILLSAILFRLMPDWYLVNLGRSFAIQLLLAFAVLAFYSLIRSRYIIGLGFCLATGIMALNYSSYMYIDKVVTSEVVNEAVDFKVAHFNVLKFNKHYPETIKRALDTNADFISFQEIDTGWAKALHSELIDQYPYQKVVAREDCYGIAVYSKHPIEGVQVHYWSGIPNISGDLVLPKGKLHFLASHTKSPISYGNFKKRNHQINEIANYASNKSGALITIGDYNAVPWDTTLRKLKHKTQLKDSRKSLTATYPSSLGVIGLPIDYIFHSSKLKCLQFNTIVGTHSDHLGIVGTYRFVANSITSKTT